MLKEIALIRKLIIFTSKRREAFPFLRLSLADAITCLLCFLSLSPGRYVKVYLLPDRSRSGKRKTKVCKGTLNPVFNEKVRFNLTMEHVEGRSIWLTVWHSDRFGRNDFLGEVTLPLGRSLFDHADLKWYPLQDKVSNLIFFFFSFFSPSPLRWPC